MSEVHVAHLMRTLGNGGMERVLTQVVRALKPRGTRHSVILLSDTIQIPADIGGLAEQIVRIEGAAGDRTVPWKVAKIVRELGATVLHARNRAVWFDAVAAKAFLPSTPLILSYHGRESSGPAPLKDRLEYQALSRAATRFFAVSGAARTGLVEDFGMSETPIAVIRSGVDTDRFKPREDYDRPTPKSRLVLGMVGRLARVKNPALLIRAVSVLVARGHDLHLRIAGVSDFPAFVEELEKMVGDLGLRDRVTFVGAVDDVPGFLRGLDIFALTSKLEGYPSSLLEAQACGLPCVATAVGGSVEALGDAGILIPSNDNFALIAALESLIASPERRAELARKARAHAETSLSNRRMFEDYLALYRDPVGAGLA
jgi:glycosyltransferase involved in cell wall biosynthesis